LFNRKANARLVGIAGITSPVYTAAPTRLHPPVAPKRTAAPTAEPMSAEDRRAHAEGVRLERRRWATVLKSRAFAAQPVAGAHALAATSMPAGDIIGLLKQISADVNTAYLQSPAVINAGWNAAFNKLSSTKSRS